MNEQIQEKRDRLKVLSKSLQPLVEEGEFPSINAALVDLYGKQGHTELNSFKKWKDKGYIVRRGEKALLLWGEPKMTNKQEKPEQGKEEKDEYKFWPLAFVFSQLQVEPMKHLTR